MPSRPAMADAWLGVNAAPSSLTRPCSPRAESRPIASWRWPQSSSPIQGAHRASPPRAAELRGGPVEDRRAQLEAALLVLDASGRSARADLGVDGGLEPQRR